MTSEILGYIVGIVGLLGVIFTVYSYFRDPQVKSEKVDALLDYRLQGVEKAIVKITTNDLPHFDSKLDDVHHDISSVKEKLVALTAIIEERIPRK